MPVVPEQARQSTLNINSIHGGLPVPEEGYTGFPSACVPDKCVITIDRRYLMEEEPDGVRGEIEQMLDKIKAERPGFDWEICELWQVHPSMTEKEAPVVGAVGRAIEAVTGQPPDFVVSPGTYDQKHIDRIGKLKNCIAYGPGILELAHQPDEWISITDMMDSAAVMGLALADLLIPETGK